MLTRKMLIKESFLQKHKAPKFPQRYDDYADFGAERGFGNVKCSLLLKNLYLVFQE